MPEGTPDNLQKKIEQRLRYYEDLGIRLFYKVRQPSLTHPSGTAMAANAVESLPSFLEEELSLRKMASSPRTVEKVFKPASELIHLTTPSDLFAEVARVKDDTLLRIREDIGDCTRCKLHRGRNKIVFGDGNPRAKLVFVGEAPGADAGGVRAG